MTTTKIVKSFGSKTAFEIENGTHVTSRTSWERMKPYLAEVFGLKGNEVLEGVVADEDGIHARIAFKK